MNRASSADVVKELAGTGFLTRVDIEGFKSIKKGSLELHNINVLIGPNGSGKSNFISSMAFLDSIIAKDLQITVAKNGLSSLLYKGKKETDRISMRFHFQNTSYGFDLETTDESHLAFDDEYLEMEGRRKNVPGPKGYFESRIDKTLDTGMTLSDVLGTSGWRRYHFHDTSRDSRIRQEHNLYDNDFLRQDGSNLAAFLYMLRKAHPESYEDIRRTVNTVAPFFKDFVLIPNQFNPELIMLKWEQVGCDETFNVSQLSDGTLRFMCLATLLLQPEKFQQKTIILDEPELGLHPFAISLLAEMVYSVAVDHQIIISTQSADLVSEFDPEDVIVTETGENGTTFNRLDAKELEYWLDKDYSLGDFWKKNYIGGRP